MGATPGLDGLDGWKILMDDGIATMESSRSNHPYPLPIHLSLSLSHFHVETR